MPQPGSDSDWAVALGLTSSTASSSGGGNAGVTTGGGGANPHAPYCMDLPLMPIPPEDEDKCCLGIFQCDESGSIIV